MSVVAELGLRPVRPSVLGAPVRFVGSTALGARLVSRVIPGIDRAVLRLSGGRITAVDRLSGLPAIELTTTGARSGAARTVLLSTGRLRPPRAAGGTAAVAVVVDVIMSGSLGRAPEAGMGPSVRSL